MATRNGRPRNSGLDDNAMVQAVEVGVATGAHASERAAILAIAGDDESVVRRLQRKVGRRRLAREGDLGCLPDLGLSFPPPRRHGCFFVVDVGVVDGSTLSLAHGTLLSRPMLLKMVDGDVFVPASAIPRHPVFLALDRVAVQPWWDDPDYRGICELVGLDPDSGRPFLHPLFARYQADTAAGMPPESPLVPRRSAFSPAGKGLDGGRLDLLASQLAAEGTWPDGGLATAAVAAEPRIDWSANPTRADFDLVPTPWTDPEGYGGIAVDVGREWPGGLYRGFPQFGLNVIVEPASHRLAGRRAARNLESHGFGLVLSDVERAWLAELPGGRTGAADGGHASMLANAIAEAYRGHVLRRGGDPGSPPARDLGAFPAGWDGLGGRMEWRYPPGRRIRRASGTVSMDCGKLHVLPHGDGGTLVTTSRHGIRHAGRVARFSCSFGLPHAVAPSALPHMGAGAADFEACYVDDLSPLPPDLALGLVSLSLPYATMLARDHLDVEPEHDRTRRERGGCDRRHRDPPRSAVARGAAALGRRLGLVTP